MDVVTVSSFGLFRSFNLKTTKSISHYSALGHKVKCACWGCLPNEIFLGTEDGIIAKQVCGEPIALFSKLESKIVALFCNGSEKSSLISVESSGRIKVLSASNGENLVEFSSTPELEAATSFESWVATGGRNSNLSVWDFTNADRPIFLAKNVRPTTLDLEVPIWISDISFVPRRNGRILVTGSRTGEFNLYDLRCNQRRPVSRHTWRASRKHGKIKVGTCSHSAVLPDLTATRPITKVVAIDDAPGVGIRTVAGNAIGDLCFLDLRLPSLALLEIDSASDRPIAVKSRGSRAAEPPVNVKTLLPACGAITGLAYSGADEANSPVLLWPPVSSNGISCFNDEQRVLVTSSLDRFLRVYDRDSGERLARLYAKVPITSLLISHDARFDRLVEPSQHQEEPDKCMAGEGDSAAPSNSSSSDDEVWDQMELVGDSDAAVVCSDTTPKRRRKK